MWGKTVFAAFDLNSLRVEGGRLSMCFFVDFDLLSLG